MIIASRNMTTVEIKKLTIGYILVEQVLSTHNEEGIDWIHYLEGQVSDLSYYNAENSSAPFRNRLVSPELRLSALTWPC
jgi:hypothetical protein